MFMKLIDKINQAQTSTTKQKTKDTRNGTN